MCSNSIDIRRHSRTDSVLRLSQQNACANSKYQALSRVWVGCGWGVGGVWVGCGWGVGGVWERDYSDIIL